jgi:hypothetical protein
MNSKKFNKRELIKNKIIKGSGRQTHYNEKYIEPKTQKINTLCNCEIKCANLFTEFELKDVFNRYYSLKSHNEQHLFSKSLVIPSKKEIKIRHNFDYFIEVINDGNEV